LETIFYAMNMTVRWRERPRKDNLKEHKGCLFVATQEEDKNLQTFTILGLSTTGIAVNRVRHATGQRARGADLGNTGGHAKKHSKSRSSRRRSSRGTSSKKSSKRIGDMREPRNLHHRHIHLLLLLIQTQAARRQD
jgi:hypothetical protein